MRPEKWVTEMEYPDTRYCHFLKGNVTPDCREENHFHAAKSKGNTSKHAETHQPRHTAFKRIAVDLKSQADNPIISHHFDGTNSSTSRKRHGKKCFVIEC